MVLGGPWHSRGFSISSIADDIEGRGRLGWSCFPADLRRPTGYLSALPYPRIRIAPSGRLFGLVGNLSEGTKVTLVALRA